MEAKRTPQQEHGFSRNAFALAVSNIFEKYRKTCEQVVDLIRLCKVGEGTAKKGATQIALLLVGWPERRRPGGKPQSSAGSRFSFNQPHFRYLPPRKATRKVTKRILQLEDPHEDQGLGSAACSDGE